MTEEATEIGHVAIIGMLVGKALHSIDAINENFVFLTQLETLREKLLDYASSPLIEDDDTASMKQALEFVVIAHDAYQTELQQNK